MNGTLYNILNSSFAFSASFSLIVCCAFWCTNSNIILRFSCILSTRYNEISGSSSSFSSHIFQDLLCAHLWRTFQRKIHIFHVCWDLFCWFNGFYSEYIACFHCALGAIFLHLWSKHAHAQIHTHTQNRVNSIFIQLPKWVWINFNLLDIVHILS